MKMANILCWAPIQRAEEREQSIHLNLYWKGVNNNTVNITDDGRSNMPLSVLYTNMLLCLISVERSLKPYYTSFQKYFDEMFKFYV